MYVICKTISQLILQCYSVATILCSMFTKKLSNYKTVQTVPETLSEMKSDSKDNDLAFNKTKTKVFLFSGLRRSS